MKKMKRDPNNFPWRVAASIILLMACGLLYLLIDLDKDYEVLSQEHQKTIQYYNQKLKESEELLQSKSDLLAFITHQRTDKVKLLSSNVNVSDEAVLYWNADSHHVWLDHSNLPALDNQHSYQLWAFENDQPINLGIVDESDVAITKMNAVDAADSFVITLESFGGSEQPTLSAIKVIGEI